MLVLTIGSFDGLHDGHLRLLERAAGYGELTVGVNTDAFIESYKQLLPAQPLERRIQALRGVGYRAVPSEGSGIDLIHRVRPDLLAVGSDWLDNNYTGQLGTTRSELDILGVSVLFLTRTPGISSSELREAA